MHTRVQKNLVSSFVSRYHSCNFICSSGVRMVRLMEWSPMRNLALLAMGLVRCSVPIF